MKTNWKEFEYDFYMWAPRRKFRDFWRSIRYGVPNLIKWFPIIWKDRDFDGAYFEDLLRFKLRNMMHFFYGPDTHILNAYKYAEQIEEVLYLFDKLSDDHYIEDIDPNYFAKFETGNINSFIEYLNNKTDEQRKKDMLAHTKALFLEKQDRERAYQLLGERIKEWWD